MECTNKAAIRWVEEIAAKLTPERIVWVTGSEEEYEKLCATLVEDGTFTRLNNEEYPNSYWSVSDPTDVARVEGRTYICSQSEDDSGPTNNWAEPEAMKKKLDTMMAGCMKGRTMYVIPYMMGPDGSPFSKVGFELTDSAYVVANMRIMARIGETALRNLPDDYSGFIRGVHSLGTLDPDGKYICHFPEERTIISFNSGYGGNALQGKKCFALRIASVEAKEEGWLAEHMLILGLTSPDGDKKYVCAAFPSACGKTNLAMLIPPRQYLENGWKVETVGDDIAWLRFGKDGRLYAVNPEYGFFGVAPGTSEKTNPNAMASLRKGNIIFTNTAFDPVNRVPWWEGINGAAPEKLIDWKKREYDPACGEKAAHPNSRFTCPAANCPSIDPEWESANGVPISAIVFGGRRAKTVPLVYEATSWKHGTFLGVTMASETTAAATGTVGQLRRDPMAMKPFIGYHAADYFRHWLEMGEKGKEKMPAIFHVNWFRTDENGKFLWPGFGDNIRILEWMVKRIDGKIDAIETAVGLQPAPSDINFEGLNMQDKDIQKLFEVDPEEWKREVMLQKDYLASFGEKLPAELWQEHEALKKRLGN